MVQITPEPSPKNYDPGRKIWFSEPGPYGGGGPNLRTGIFWGRPPKKMGFWFFFQCPFTRSPHIAMTNWSRNFHPPLWSPLFEGGPHEGGGSEIEKVAFGFFASRQCCCTQKVQQMSFWSPPPSPLRSPIKNVFKLLSSVLRSSCVMLVLCAVQDVGQLTVSCRLEWDVWKVVE